MPGTKELLQLDLYSLLGVTEEATDKEIKKAYRQKALTCHPDKNPDNPRAAELFHQLSQALEVLTDAAARAAYDKVRKAKKQAEERTRKLDDKRKKVKLDLEAREREAQAEKKEEEEIWITRTLEEEIERLREEGSRQLEEQQKLMQEQIRLEREQRPRGMQRDIGLHVGCIPAGLQPGRTWQPSGLQEGIGSDSRVTPKLKLKWKCNKDDGLNGGYSQDVLLRLLQKYGDVLNLLISSKKKGSAIVEFATVKAAALAVKNEAGLTANPLKVSWLEGEPPSEAPARTFAPFSSFQDGASQVKPAQDSVRSERDYESVVMMRMRQAAERQRLINQLKEEDEKETNT
ncbi:dnaJ homolog subfamily C member 17 isoform X1 [Latimeria chalumnae]|uniref:dnaJ homolog subfamily C member 17 isoform X1 n=1 Tax=Latimeria chalumnae TaxID=7897 RepID=UPI0006D8EB83|nr:PREDICTED: dnaJ homolog subfamily C member 17 isoform X1 [Latimeria chalumnae]|eukprot:XP_014340936.1 PREDICTED: dnaJ homolog subfamily C member 17 isoform X1 [Latimeria chalumnae]